MVEDFERCYRLIQSRDPRHDGRFVVAVASTKIYCRPSCPARSPQRSNVRFFATAAAAQVAGFRACKRCRPDTAPGSPMDSGPPELADRALRLISDGIVERDGVGGLAKRLSFSERQLHRILSAQLGAGPLALARVHRAGTARTLIEGTSLPFAEIALTAGFNSVRQFNETIRGVYALTPTEMRRRAASSTGASTPGTIEMQLAYRRPFDAASMLSFLRDRAVPGIEEVVDSTYRRSVSLEHGNGLVELTPSDDVMRCRLRLDDFRDLTAAVARCRRLLDLDADPIAVGQLLGADPILGSLVARHPGLRVPGCLDGGELAIRALINQQISVKAAQALCAKLVRDLGPELPQAVGTVTNHFPSMATLAELDPSALPMPLKRAATLCSLAQLLAGDELVLDAGADPDQVVTRLLRIPGVGPWTASYITMRALGNPDVFLPTDVGIRRALRSLGHRVDWAGQMAEAWRPWRSYAVVHLWTSLSDLQGLNSNYPSTQTQNGARF